MADRKAGAGAAKSREMKGICGMAEGGDVGMESGMDRGVVGSWRGIFAI